MQCLAYLVKANNLISDLDLNVKGLTRLLCISGCTSDVLRDAHRGDPHDALHDVHYGVCHDDDDDDVGILQSLCIGEDLTSV